MPLRKFKYLGPEADSIHYGALVAGDVIECDTVNDTPDGGIPSQWWEEVDG